MKITFPFPGDGEPQAWRSLLLPVNLPADPDSGPDGHRGEGLCAHS